MELPGHEFMTPTSHGSSVSSTLRGAVSTRTPTFDHRERCETKSRRTICDYFKKKKALGMGRLMSSLHDVRFVPKADMRRLWSYEPY
jgi:hypothetical protein